VGQYGALGFQVGEKPISQPLKLPQREEISISDTQLPKQEKHPSKRMRSAIFVLWEKKGSIGDFDEYYREIIEYFRKKILAEIDRLED
jgi:hypothetical protein